jgi:hypothetical protein
MCQLAHYEAAIYNLQQHCTFLIGDNHGKDMHTASIYKQLFELQRIDQAKGNLISDLKFELIMAKEGKAALQA